MAKVTLRQVADKCGVSVAAASMALRGVGTVSKETQERVRQKATEMGYRPNPILSSLASKHFHSPGPNKDALMIYLTNLGPAKKQTLNWTGFEAFKKHAESLGYRAEHLDLGNTGYSGDALTRILHARGCIGIVIGPSSRTTGLRELDWEHFAVVAAGIHRYKHPFHRVRGSVFASTAYAWKELKRRGYKRIGCAINFHADDLEDDHLRLGAVLSCHHTTGTPIEVPPFLGLHNDGDAFKKWYLLYRPDAVLCFGQYQLYFLLELGVKVPEEVALIALHTKADKIEKMRVTGVLEITDRYASTAVDLCDRLIRHREFGIPKEPIYQDLPFEWIEGDTAPVLVAS